MIPSKIIELIKSDPGWKETIENLGIKYKQDGDLAIFNYGISCDFTNPIVQEARGIIIDIKNLRVVCWPYRKFGNAHEPYADTINWDSCRVEDKIDGSIVKLYHWNGKWKWATNSCIDALYAPVTNDKMNFLGVIQSAVNYSAIPFDELDQNLTYIFELVSPETQVVIRYPQTKLFHIGTRNNVTGEEYRISIGIEQPKTYPLHTLDDCIEAAKNLNAGNMDVKKEGFVVVDNEWHRIKVKSPEYLMAHRLWSNGNVSKDRIIQILKEDSRSIEEICKPIPRLSVYMKYYDYRIAELEQNVSDYIDYVRGMYEEHGHDRKAVALQIKDQKYAGFGFKAIGNNKTAKEILDEMSFSKYSQLIPDYVRSDII